jgi:hypothetical protein
MDQFKIAPGLKKQGFRVRENLKTTIYEIFCENSVNLAIATFMILENKNSFISLMLKSFLKNEFFYN